MSKDVKLTSSLSTSENVAGFAFRGFPVYPDSCRITVQVTFPSPLALRLKMRLQCDILVNTLTVRTSARKMSVLDVQRAILALPASEAAQEIQSECRSKQRHRFPLLHFFFPPFFSLTFRNKSNTSKAKSELNGSGGYLANRDTLRVGKGRTHAVRSRRKKDGARAININYCRRQFVLGHKTSFLPSHRTAEYCSGWPLFRGVFLPGQMSDPADVPSPRRRLPPRAAGIPAAVGARSPPRQRRRRPTRPRHSQR